VSQPLLDDGLRLTELSLQAGAVQAVHERVRHGVAGHFHPGLETTEKTMVAVKSTVADERTLYQLQNTLREVGEAARSLRQLGDYLERHPDAIIRGRKEGG
jgi:paraquat-inducible protein B